MENKLWTRQANINLLLALSKLLLSVWIMTLTCFVTAQNTPLRYIAYPADSLQNITPNRFFQSTLGLKAPNSFVVRDSITVSQNSLLLYFRQLYDGLEVINSRLYLTYRNGLLQRYTGFYLPIASDFNTRAQLSEKDAEQIYRLRHALPDTAKIDMRTARVIMENPDTAAWSGGNRALLCYRIVAAGGFYGPALYINAHTGAILLEQNSYSAGNFNTRYYGAQSAPNFYYSSPYGGACYYNQKYTLQTPANFPRFVVHDAGSYDIYAAPNSAYDGECSPFYDSDNSWTAAEHSRNYAQDAYWGVYNTISYFMSKYNWSGFDGTGHSAKNGSSNFYVIVDVNSFGQLQYMRDNAVWYRDLANGSSSSEGSKGVSDSYYYILVGQTQHFQPFTSIDIMAHEYAHGVDDYTSELGIYTGPNPEIYALAEGLSDIWGAVVEHEYAPSASGQDEWTVGEKPMNGGYLRNMAFPEDPNAQMKMVREYRDSTWNRYFNAANSSNDYNKYALSGVLSYWFYLLVNGDGCTVNGIGWEKAAKIVFNTQRYGRGINNYTYGNFEGFQGFAWATVSIVRDLLGMDVVLALPADPSFTPSDLEELISAWEAVNINVGNSSNGESGSEINGNVVWDHSKLITSTVTVNPGATLTITGIIHFKEEAALVIKPGG
ncbi:MAG: M4 family metallopeptidase, partial [Bacteroidales bacterium]|nr:M4 family metallopeptidase [Bacteroidales bacterium]